MGKDARSLITFGLLIIISFGIYLKNENINIAIFIFDASYIM